MKVNRGMKNLQKEILSCPFHCDTGFWFTNDWSIFELVTHVCPHFHRLSSDDSPKGHRTGHRLRTQTHNFTPVSPGPTASAMNHTGRFFSLWNDIWDKVLIYQYIKAIKIQTSFIAFSTNRKLGITCTRRYLRDFSGGPAAKTPNAGVLGSTFGQRTKIPHAATKTGYSQINKQKYSKRGGKKRGYLNWSKARPRALCMHAKSLQSCWILCNPTDSSPPAPLYGILQARILKWVAMPSSRGSSWPRDWTHVSYLSCTGRRVFFLTTGKDHYSCPIH